MESFLHLRMYTMTSATCNFLILIICNKCSLWNKSRERERERERESIKTKIDFWNCFLFIGYNWHCICIHGSLYTVFQKSATKLIVVTSSNLNRFSFFHHSGKIKKLPITLYIIAHHTLAMLPHYLWKIKFFKFVANLKENANKNVTWTS